MPHQQEWVDREGREITPKFVPAEPMPAGKTRAEAFHEMRGHLVDEV